PLELQGASLLNLRQLDYNGDGRSDYLLVSPYHRPLSTLAQTWPSLVVLQSTGSGFIVKPLSFVSTDLNGQRIVTSIRFGKYAGGPENAQEVFKCNNPDAVSGWEQALESQLLTNGVGTTRCRTQKCLKKGIDWLDCYPAPYPDPG